MDQPLLAIVGLLLALMLLGSPVIFAIGFAGLAYFFVKPGMTDMLDIYAHKFFTGMDVFIWLSIPLFIIAGEIMSAIGMTERLVNLSRLLVGRLRGGLAYVNVVGSMMFAGVSGSALADISALGPVEIEMMEKDGYDKDFSAALTVSSAIQGPIIPPSIPLIMFSALTNTSVAALFLAGAVPGIMLGLGQMALIFVMARRFGFKANPIANLTLAVALNIVGNAFFAIFMPMIIIGGIISGIFTATEAAAVAVAYALLVGFLAYRNLSLKALWAILDRSARTSASVYLIVGFATIISWVLANERLPNQLGDLVAAYNLQPWMLLLALNIFFLINGLWIGDSVQLLLFAPLFTPILAQMGVDPVHFGVIMVMNVMIGLMTPPYGLALYLGSSISGVSLGRIVRASLPFLCSNLVVLLLVTYVPAISLTLPRLLGFF
ncbi:tripartite ATP-independent transporter DctM subunit [Gemmobacter caeni]|uniref:TRAP transporter large permease protein n=1 Tax=Gemmobacter caeni TaxID=589035 RepID=A0A2T6AJN3_9RHOB|nr:TRAP transporter large permease [Gemmobacter caeni]PTX44025.1 tripartite ATP-independent transporter DctM subunit [Gemmobacter caeni]TWI93673.1 tripartite ATP-independent transporter DctM subunit [Gemmobacter caeni]